MKKIIIVGASSGIGNALARLLLSKGYIVGIAARRLEPLRLLQQEFPTQTYVEKIDVMNENSSHILQEFIIRMGGIDLFFLASGIGKQNLSLEEEVEQNTLRTNVLGFARMVGTAFHYFSQKKDMGHIAVISSIAATRGLGAAPSYSASKAFQNNYMEALEQLARMRKLPILLTDIRPGFVKTSLLEEDKEYPMLMQPNRVAESIYKALLKKKSVKVIDFRYRIMVFIWKLFPRWLWTRLKIKN